jgi:hypothetical protein
MSLGRDTSLINYFYMPNITYLHWQPCIEWLYFEVGGTSQNISSHAYSHSLSSGPGFPSSSFLLGGEGGFQGVEMP